jgi:hypothetical protein
MRWVSESVGRHGYTNRYVLGRIPLQGQMLSTLVIVAYGIAQTVPKTLFIGCSSPLFGRKIRSRRSDPEIRLDYC